MDFLTNPFTTALLFLYQLLSQNIFLTILGFTVIIRLLLLPLTYQQLKSTKSMQTIQPKMKELQEKYKGDREKLARAQMELYQQNGVNPLAGCLPLVVQLPILYGLYGAISRALSANPLQLLDLSHRLLVPSLANLIPLQNHFLIWNLATPDTSYILPVLVIGSTWLSQKLLTPPPTGGGNDASAAMSRNMLIMMPLLMGVFSLNIASGVAMYWVIGGLAVILQYAALGRLHIRNLMPAFLASRLQPAGAPAEIVVAPQTTNNKKANSSQPASSNGNKLAPANGKPAGSKPGTSKARTVESTGKQRKVSIDGPVGKPNVKVAKVVDEPDVPIAAVPRKMKPVNKSNNKPATSK